MRRPRLELVGIRLEPGPSISLTQVCWIPILALSCDLSFFIRTESFILASSSPQGGRRPPGGWSMTFVQEAGLPIPTSAGKPGPSQYNHWGLSPPLTFEEVPCPFPAPPGPDPGLNWL